MGVALLRQLHPRRGVHRAERPHRRRAQLDGRGARADPARGAPRALRRDRQLTHRSGGTRARRRADRDPARAPSTSSSWSSRRAADGDAGLRPRSPPRPSRSVRCSRYAVTGSRLPFTCIGGTASTTACAPSSRNVASPMRTPPTGAAAWSRAARLTTSPTTPCLRWPRVAPTRPACTSPLDTPTRKRGQSSCSAAVRSATRWSTSAARAARNAWSRDRRVLPEDDHQLVADDLVHLAARALHQRDDPAEVGVQHRRDLVRRA